MRERTTDLNLLRNDTPFTWGNIIELLDIGPYTIAVFVPWKTDEVRVMTGVPDSGNTRYHGWLNGRDTSTTWTSLDAALAGLIAYRHEGQNSRAGMYFMKMIGVEE